MLKKRVKNAFTLAEVLVVLGIAGFIMMMMVIIIKPNDRYLGQQYYKAYYTLATATYNIYQDNLHTSNTDVYLPTGKELCTKLRGYMNSTTDYDCSNTYVSYKGDSFPDASIQFIASNGMKIWFSSPIEDDDTGKHRIVWIDINGKKGPNTATWKKNKPSDIVAFDILDTGEVVPLGYPKIDTRYMSTELYVPDNDEEDNSGNKEESTRWSFYNAQQLAFGGKQFRFDSFSYRTDERGEFQGSALEIQGTDKPPKMNMYERCIDPVNGEDVEFSQCSIDIVKAQF